MLRQEKKKTKNWKHHQQQQQQQQYQTHIGILHLIQLAEQNISRQSKRTHKHAVISCIFRCVFFFCIFFAATAAEMKLENLISAINFTFNFSAQCAVRGARCRSKCGEGVRAVHFQFLCIIKRRDGAISIARSMQIITQMLPNQFVRVRFEFPKTQMNNKNTYLKSIYVECLRIPALNSLFGNSSATDIP